MASRNLNRYGLSVEQLEDRQLLSVTVTPAHINLKSIDHGQGVFTVRVSGTDSTTMALLQSPSSLTETVTEGSTSVTLNKPLRTVTTGNGTLMLKFRRSDLMGLGAGDATLTVNAASASSSGSGSISGSGTGSETATITIFGTDTQGHHGGNGGQGHQGHSGDHGGPGHHGHSGDHGHGHGHD